MGTDTANGVTFSWGTSLYAQNAVSLSDLGQERTAIETTHLNTSTARTHTPGALVESGTLTFEMQWDPTDRPPIAGAAETLTITFDDGYTCSCSAFCTSFMINNINTEESALLTATVAFKVSGDLTWTAP
jgi:hypothetical protein